MRVRLVKKKITINIPQCSEALGVRDFAERRAATLKGPAFELKHVGIPTVEFQTLIRQVSLLQQPLAVNLIIHRMGIFSTAPIG